MVRVTVIDDDVDTVKVFSEFLKIKGIDVVGTGNNGKDAVKLYKQFRPDITITDMKMPEYDGKYAIEQIKKIDPLAKIIVVTGYSDYHFDNGEVEEVFHKPYDIDKIINRINGIMV